MSDLINPHGLDLGRTLQRRLAEAEAEIARLREALEPFAEAAEECDEYGFDDSNQAPVDAGQCREARAALSSPHATKGEAG